MRDVSYVAIASIFDYRSDITVDIPAPILESGEEDIRSIDSLFGVHVATESAEISSESRIEAVCFFTERSSEVTVSSTIILEIDLTYLIESAVYEAPIIDDLYCPISIDCIDTMITIHAEGSGDVSGTDFFSFYLIFHDVS
jgi:hypothetical protein